MTIFYREFQENIALIDISDEIEYTLLETHFNYAYMITCMERYLSKAMIETMDNHSQCYINLAKKVDSSAKLSTIYRNGLEVFIKKEILGNFQFHNISSVKIYYKNTFDITFPSNLRSIYQAISKRHDIIHRCGFSKTEVPVNISKESVISLKDEIQKFILHIDIQLEDKYYS